MAEKSEAKLGKNINAAAMEAYAVKDFGSIYKELNGHEMMFHPEASLLRELFDIYVDVSWQFIEDQCFASPCVHFSLSTGSLLSSWAENPWLLRGQWCRIFLAPAAWVIVWDCLVKLNSGRQVSTHREKESTPLMPILSCNQPFFVIGFVQRFDFLPWSTLLGTHNK